MKALPKDLRWHLWKARSMRSIVMPRELRGAPPFVFADRHCAAARMTVEMLDCAYFPAYAARTHQHPQVCGSPHAGQPERCATAAECLAGSPQRWWPV